MNKLAAFTLNALLLVPCVALPAAELQLAPVFGDHITLTGEPAGFVIAGADGKFFEAKAQVVNRTSVAVWSDRVADPVYVRYAWSGMPFCHLVTESGLPVGVFRTDNFPTSSAHM